LKSFGIEGGGKRRRYLDREGGIDREGDIDTEGSTIDRKVR
jgi:hypothetical protein